MMPVASTGKRGDAMEFLAALVFQSQGYLVRRAVPFQYGGSEQEATDIDVVGLRVTQPFQLHRIICDCKDRQRSKPYERIFWVRGLATFINASETYVSVPRAGAEIVKFAKSGRVRVLTEGGLRQAATKARPYSFANPDFVNEVLPKAQAGMKTDKRCALLMQQIRRVYLSEDPYVGLNVVMYGLETTAAALRSTEPGRETFEAWRLLAGECLVLISVLLLAIAGDTLGLQREDRRRHITDRLTYGDLSPQKAEEFFGLVREAAREASLLSSRSTPVPSPLPFDLGKIEPPDYTDDLVGLVERAILQPEFYASLPQLIDYLVFEQAMRRRTFDEQQFRSEFPLNQQEEKLKVARNVFVLARDRAKLDLSAFWPRQEGYLPRGRMVENSVSPVSH